MGLASARKELDHEPWRTSSPGGSAPSPAAPAPGSSPSLSPSRWPPGGRVMSTAMPYGVRTVGNTNRSAAAVGAGGSASGAARGGSYCSSSCRSATRKKMMPPARNCGSAPKNRRPTPVKRCWAFQLPLLGSNQDSPDPERASKPPEFQQLATVYASSCHPMLEFAGFDAGLCRPLLAQMLRFAQASDIRRMCQPTHQHANRPPA
jgi:hypothetical protein